MYYKKLNKFNLVTIFLIIIFGLVLTACATWVDRAESVCSKIPEGERSVLCETGIDLESADSVLIVFNAVALRKGYYKKEDVEKVFDQAEASLEGDIYYSDFAGLLLSKVKTLQEKYPVETIVLTKRLKRLANIKIPIGQYDKYLLKAHFANQRQEVLIFY